MKIAARSTTLPSTLRQSSVQAKLKRGTLKAGSFAKKAVFKPRLVKLVAARTFRNKLRFGSGIFSAVQGPNCVDGTIRGTIRFILQEGAGARQLTTRPATDTMTFAARGYR